MRRLTTLGVIAGLVALFALDTQAQRATATAGPVTLRGVVVDAENGAGVPRMRLDVIMGGKRTAGTLTEDDGTFSVEITAPDRVSIASFATVSLRTFKAGYANITVSFAPNQVRAPGGVRLAVPRAGVITGRIVSGPFALHAATIVMARRDGDGSRFNQNVFTAPQSQVIVTTTPDEDGHFRIGGLPAGRYTLEAPIVIPEPAGGVRTAASDGRVRMASAVVDVAAGAEVTVELVYEEAFDALPVAAAQADPAGGSLIHGRVTATDGVPLSNAMVNARLGGRSWNAMTDASGQFTLRDLPPGSFTVNATRSGYLSAEHGQRGANLPGLPVVVERGKDVDGVTIMLSRGGVISGIVLDEYNEPLQDVAIRLSRVRQSATGLPSLQQSGGRPTDDRGMFRLSNVPPGEYLLTAVLPSEITTEASGTRTAYVPAFYPDTHEPSGALPLRLAAGDVVAGVVLTIRRVPVSRVTGVVQNSQGTPFTGTLRLAHRHIGGFSGGFSLAPRVTEPDTSGVFTFAEVPPGSYVLRASVPSGPDGPEVAERAVTVTDRDPEPLSIRTLPSSRVSGHFVLDAPPGELLWGYSIRTFAVESASSSGSMTNVGSPASNGHTFAISGLSGPTRLVVTTGDEDWYLRSITIDGADVTDVPFDFGFDGRVYTGVEVVFSRFGASVAGRATDDRAMPVGDYAVYVFPTDRDKWFAGSRWLKLVRSAADGTFHVPALPPGDYWLAAVDRVDLTPNGSDWVDADLLDALSSRATRATLGEGHSQTVTLRIVRR